MSNHAVPPISSLIDYHRIVLLTDGCSSPFLAKTAISMLRYREPDIAAVYDTTAPDKTAFELFGCGGNVPIVDALDQVIDADALLIGIAPPGGRLPQKWRDIVRQAIDQKIDIISGLHQFLCDDPEFRDAANVSGAKLIDVRKNDERQTGCGCEFDPKCTRIQTVGQDCSVGKMVVAIEIERGLRQRGLDAGFAATGQTGMMIAGAGTPIDCVVSDFVNGATERLIQANQDHDFLLIEGQGSITHPAYSAVTLGLLHGAAPDALILCYEATRKFVKGFGEIPLHGLSLLRSLYEQLAETRHPCSVIGVAMNGRLLDATEFASEKARWQQELDLPVCDVLREGPDELVDAVIRRREELTK